MSSYTQVSALSGDSSSNCSLYAAAPANSMARTPRRSTRGPRSLNLAGTQDCHTGAGSTTWSSTLMILGIDSSSMAATFLVDRRARGPLMAALLRQLLQHRDHVASAAAGLGLDPLPFFGGGERGVPHVVPPGVQRGPGLGAKAGGIVEVDAGDDLVIDRSQHVDAVLDEPVVPLVDRCLGVNLEGQVLEYVIRRMGR